jgi:CrcB protein
MIPLYVAFGGAAGAVARYALAGLVQNAWGARFPWGTAVVNILGSLLIGVAMRSLEALPASPELRALVTMGLLGGFTTFSTYTYESLTLLRDGLWLRAAAYSLGSLGMGVLAVAIGWWLSAALIRPGV